MTTRTVVVRLQAEYAGFQRAMAAAAQGVEGAGKAADKAAAKVRETSSSIDELSGKAALGGAGLLGFAAMAVKSFADFDAAMSQVKASGADAAGSIDALRRAAITAGADTQYSATEAAGAITDLAKAGVSAKDILGGGLTGALNLAAAGQMDVKEAAESTATAMNQFGLSGKDASHVADLLAAGAGKAMGDVSDFSQALNQSGLVANQAGLSIEETTAGLAAFAQQGLIGSDAGTSFKTMLQALSAPSSTAKKEMDKLGISAYDAQGNFVGLANFAGQLQTKMEDLTPAQRNAAMATIFGSDAVRAAGVLYTEGASGIQEWTDAVNDQGYAAKSAATLTDNLKGDLERLGGSIDTVFIQAGSGANDTLRQMTQSAGALVDAIGKLPQPVLTATTAIAGSGGLALLGVAGLGKLTTSISAAKAGMVGLGLSAKAAKIAMVGIGAGIGVATIAIGVWAQKQAEAKANADNLTASLDEQTGAYTQSTDALIAQAISTEKIGGNAFGMFGTTVSDVATRLGVDLNDLQQAILGNAEAMARVQAVTGSYRDDSGKLGRNAQDLTGFINDQQAALGTATKTWKANKDALGEASQSEKAAGVATTENTSAVQQYSDALADGTATATTYTDALKEVVDAQKKAAGIVLSAREAERQFQASIDDASEAVKKNGKTLDTSTEKGRANQAALDDIASSAWDVIDAQRANGASEEDLQGKMAGSRKAFIRAAEAMGMSKSQANALADQLNLIPKNVKVDVNADTSQASRNVSILSQQIAKLPNGKTITITTNKVTKESSFVVAGTGLKGNATGGAITGPGTGTSDSIPAMLSNGEHVLTASDVVKVGGQAAVYRMRNAIQAGALAFKDGGAVSSARTAYERAQDAVDRARGRLRDANDAVRRAGKTKSESDDKAAAKRQASAEKALDDAKDTRDDARSKLDNLKAQQSDMRTDMRRGDTRDAVGRVVGGEFTGSLSSAYGVVDQMRTMAKDTDLSKSARSRLSRVASESEAKLKSLYGRLDKANDALNTMKSISDGVTDNLKSGFKLGDQFGQKNEFGYDKPVTGKGFLSSARSYAAKVKAFAGKLNSLVKKFGSGPASTAIVQEVASLGVEEGTQAADALLSLNAADTASLKSTYGQIASYSKQAGQYVSESFAKGGTAAAQSMVDSLEKQIGDVGVTMANAMLKALGLPTTSTKKKSKKKSKKKAYGGRVYGPGTGTSDDVDDVLLSNGEYVVNAAAAARYAPQLDAMNYGRPVLSAGGGGIDYETWAKVNARVLRDAGITAVVTQVGARAITDLGIREISRTDRRALQRAVNG